LTGLPKQFEVTEVEWWLMYKNGELMNGEYVSLDHVIMGKKISDGSPVWVRVGN